jgi:hypothetical protein
MEHINKKNLDDNIYIIIGILIVILVGMYLMGFFKTELSSYYPFKGLIENQVAKEEFKMLKENYNYYGKKFIELYKEKTKDIKEDFIEGSVLYPTYKSIVDELWEELSKRPEEERIATLNMFVNLSNTVNDLDKKKLKETIRYFYFGPLPEFLNENK